MIIYKVRYPWNGTPLYQKCLSFSEQELVWGAGLADNSHTQDLVSGDEIISDSYDMKIVDDTVYEVDCKKITKGAENIGSSFALIVAFTPPLETRLRKCLRVDIGANPSAEEQEEATDDTSKQVIDVVDSFRLNYLGDEASQTPAFDKKGFGTQFKGKDPRLIPSAVQRMLLTCSIYQAT